MREKLLRGLAFAGAVTVLAVGAVVVWWWRHPRPEPEPRPE